jgi:ABC-2 type transport system ATP-binding protein
MCDAVTVIEKGRILATGTVADILAGVRQRRTLSVRLAGSTERLETFLLEQPGVHHVHEAGGRIEFEFAGGDDEQVALVGRLVAAGFPLLEFTARSADLEDLFIQITEGRVQ